MTAFKKMIRLDIEVGVSTMKIMAGLIFEIDSNGRDTEIDLIKILLQLSVVGSEIRFLKTIVIHLVYCLVIFVFKDKYPLILCHKHFEHL